MIVQGHFFMKVNCVVIHNRSTRWGKKDSWPENQYWESVLKIREKSLYKRCAHRVKCETAAEKQYTQQQNGTKQCHSHFVSCEDKDISHRHSCNCQEAKVFFGHRRFEPLVVHLPEFPHAKLAIVFLQQLHNIFLHPVTLLLYIRLSLVGHFVAKQVLADYAKSLL